jgi:Mn2+/Fe2+ NRAMP family transporter
MSSNRKSLWKAFGPGILFASTCIGVSHLVQSTRAGADYGFELVLFIVLANLFKYPFFEFGSRYAAATGQHLLEGYIRQGRWAIWLYFLISLVATFTVTAAVTFVTAGMLNNLLGLDVDGTLMSGIVLSFCTALLLVGKFNLLDHLLKVIGAILLISTITAFVGVLIRGPIEPVKDFIPKELWERNGIIFLIALMGWMPTAVDLSTWNSIWAVEKMKQTGRRNQMKEVLFDFNFGYIITAILAICFLTLGAFVMYGSGEELSSNSTTFSDQVVRLYTQSLGSWAYLIIAIAAFSTMFSTTITVVDGYGRAMGETMRLLFFKQSAPGTLYKTLMILVSVGAFIFIWLLAANLKQLVDLATTFSFVVAPIIAWINYQVITSDQIAQKDQPPRWLKLLAISGLIFLTVFTLIYIVVYFL